MITKNPMQLKAFIKNKAAEKHISAQLVMQNYMLERLLERISLSPYKNNFILKGGFLISAIVGLDTRATMDLDTTIKGFTLTHEAIRKIFTEICAVQIADDVQFEVVGISDIRETDDYPGIRVALKANYPPIADAARRLLCRPLQQPVRAGILMEKRSEWVRCPICKNKTRTKPYEDTELRNFPLYCPKCRQETLIDVKALQRTA